MNCDENSPASVSMYLRKINIGIKRQMDKSDVKRQLDNVTGTHGYIVGYLKSRENEDVFQRDVEKRFSMRRSTASSILSLMEKNGLIVRKPVPYDARLKKIVLTDKAEDYIAFFVKEGDALEKKVTSGFSEEEVGLLCGMLKRISDNLKDDENGL